MRLYHRGDRGEAVRDVQSRLRALGFGIDGDRLGVFEDGTEQAVAAFQSARGLPACTARATISLPVPKSYLYICINTN